MTTILPAACRGINRIVSGVLARRGGFRPGKITFSPFFASLRVLRALRVNCRTFRPLFLVDSIESSREEREERGDREGARRTAMATALKWKNGSGGVVGIPRAILCTGARRLAVPFIELP